MSQKIFTQEQLQIISDAIKDAHERDKLIDYLNRHDIIGMEVFPYLSNSKPEIDSSILYNPVSYDVFIKRLPIYFYQRSLEIDGIGNFSQYAMGLYSDYKGEGEYRRKLDELYNAIERMYYHHKLDLKTIYNYPIKQTGYVNRTELLMQWANYLDLAEQYGVEEKTPKYFIVDYNKMLERVGAEPIIYEIQEQFLGEYISRTGNVISVEGIFPCDENGNPIMRWIGLDVINPTKIWAKVDERLKGHVYIEANPETAIWGLNCWGQNDDGSDCWYMLYAGPLLMEFDYEKLKLCRKREKLTQKQVAEAIGAAERTYQKWESGDTTPDCLYLLRLMNVLNIKEVEEITRVNI